VQRESGFVSGAFVARTRRSFVWDLRAGLFAAGLGVLGIALALSLASPQLLIGAGITPASILLCLLLVGVATTCGADPFHPARVLAALLALSFVVGPVAHAATGVYALPQGLERQRADLSRATWMILAGTALAMIAMRATLGDAWRGDFRSRHRSRIDRRGLLAAIGIAAAGVAFLAGYLILTGASSVSLQGRGATYAVIPNEGREAYLGLLAPIGIGGFLVIASWALERRARVAFVLASSAALGVGALMALPGSRANLLYAVTPFFLLYATYKGIPPLRWLIPGAVIVLVLLSYGASLRTADTRSALLRDPWSTLSENAPRTHQVERLFLVDMAHTEPLLGVMDAYPATRPFLGGESAAIGFTGPLGWKFGRAIGLDIDPPAGVTATAVAYGRDPSTFGGGVTATLPGELYANAGVPGVLFGLAAFGAVVGWVRRKALTSRAGGALTLYAGTITMLFAMFADYFGQFYRAGAVVIGVGLALSASGNMRFPLPRVIIACFVIAVGAAGLLTARKVLGAPPAPILENLVPVYLALAGLAAFCVVRGLRATGSPRR
jgi:hypothetical protein